MKKAEIEIGKEYAAAAPNRSGYFRSKAARVRVLAVGVWGRKSNVYSISGGGRSGRENYVLVEDLSDAHRNTVEGEYGMESAEAENIIRYGMEVTPGCDRRTEGYYTKKAAEAGGPSLTRGAKWATVPTSWILKPWVEFEKDAHEMIAQQRAEAEDLHVARIKRDDVAEELKELGVDSASSRMGGILLSAEDAESVVARLRAKEEG